MPLTRLTDLRGVGKSIAADFVSLGIHQPSDLRGRDALDLYRRLETLTQTRQDPCVLDVFTCAIAQVNDPNLPPDQRDWWYWSRRRKATGQTLR